MNRPGGERSYRIVYEFAPVGYQQGANGLTAPTGAVLTGSWTAYPLVSGDSLIEGIGFFIDQIAVAIDAALAATESAEAVTA